jgi:hypothetical protein
MAGSASAAFATVGSVEEGNPSAPSDTEIDLGEEVLEKPPPEGSSDADEPADAEGSP